MWLLCRPISAMGNGGFGMRVDDAKSLTLPQIFNLFREADEDGQPTKRGLLAYESMKRQISRISKDSDDLRRSMEMTKQQRTGPL